jgi:hypothetical protein
MFDQLFIDDDYSSTSKTGNGVYNGKNPNLNCASYLEKPDPERSTVNFVGLLNQ